MMNFEQIEGYLQDLDGKPVSVAVPIRGTICNNYYGTLTVTHDWAMSRIYYAVKFYPDMDIMFQAEDVEKIIYHPNENLDAAIILKADTTMQQSHFCPP